jgi:hypothetical protein
LAMKTTMMNDRSGRGAFHDGMAFQALMITAMGSMP